MEVGFLFTNFMTLFHHIRLEFLSASVSSNIVFLNKDIKVIMTYIF